MKILTQVWRLVRIGGSAFAAQVVAGAATNGTNLSRAALIAAGVAAVEAVYRQAVPAKEVSRLSVLFDAVKVAYGQLQAKTVPVAPVPVEPAPPAA